MMIDLCNNIEFLLAFISVILGLSIPVMLQVIERVDQRYESTRLAKRLQSEKWIKVCFYSLIASVVTCTYAIFSNFPSPWDIWILNNSAALIALLCCIMLIVTFLVSCKIILIYYNPEQLQHRILKSYTNSRKVPDKEKNFLDWVDLTKALFQASDRGPALRVYDTIKKETDDAFENAGKNGVIFPPYVAQGITSINENLCLMQRRPFSINNGNQILKNLISQPEKLSDSAYRLIWNNLQLQLFYKQEDWVYEYWSAAVQVYDYQLARLYEGEPSFEDPDIVITAEDAKNRNEQRRRFKEFHIILCSSVLREKRYDLLEKLIDYFHAMTPEHEYPLVPSSVTEIQEAFQLIKESPRLDSGAEGYYPMHGMKGIVDGIILGSVKRYLTFLYVRVFSNIGRVKRTHANYPDSSGALKKLDDDIDYINRTLPFVLDNKDLMNILSFDDFSGAKKEMSTILESIKDVIVTKEKDLKKNKPNAIDIVDKNLAEVKNIVKDRLMAYKHFVKDYEISEDVKTYYLNGVSSYFYPNVAFQHDAGISYVDMAENVTIASLSNFQHGFASVFFQKEQKRLKISAEAVFEAIKRLEICADFVIVSFGVSWEFYKSKGINGFMEKNGIFSYDDAPFICLQGGPTNIVSQTLFVMKKSDLPSLSYVAPTDEQIKKYNLELLDDKKNLYGSIIQLSQNEALLKEIDNMSDDEAKEYSLFNVFINGKMAWNNATPVVSIKLMYNMRDNGTVDSVKDIISFEKMFGERNWL